MSWATVLHTKVQKSLARFATTSAAPGAVALLPQRLNAEAASARALRHLADPAQAPDASLSPTSPTPRTRLRPSLRPALRLALAPSTLARMLSPASPGSTGP